GRALGAAPVVPGGLVAPTGFGARRMVPPAARRVGRPPAPSAAPVGCWTTRPAGWGDRGSAATSELLSPVAFRSPVAVRRFANGRTTVTSRSAARSAGGTVAAKAPSTASSYSSP